MITFIERRGLPYVGCYLSKRHTPLKAHEYWCYEGASILLG